MANENKNKKTHAEKKDAREQKKQERKELNTAEREGHGPDWVDPAQARAPAIEMRDILDWLIAQHEAPHPLTTSLEVMMMWLEAMDTGLSRSYMSRRLPRVMQLWREEGNPMRVYTREEQDWSLENIGPDTTVPILTCTWQQFQQEKALQHEVDEQLAQCLQQSMGEGEESKEDAEEKVRENIAIEQNDEVAERAHLVEPVVHDDWEDVLQIFRDTDVDSDEDW